MNATERNIANSRIEQPRYETGIPQVNPKQKDETLSPFVIFARATATAVSPVSSRTGFRRHRACAKTHNAPEGFEAAGKMPNRDHEPAVALAAGFPVPTEAQWLRLVDRVLKGADFDKRLVSRTDDGLRIEPLYTRADALPASSAHAAIRVSRAGPAWDIRQLHANSDPVSANAAILEDLAGGATSVTLQIAAPGSFGLPYEGEAIATALNGAALEHYRVALAAGEYTPDAAGSLMARWRDAGLSDAECRGAFNYDPLGTLAATGALYHPLETALGIAARLANDSRALPGLTALRADGHVYHAAGAAEAQELACNLGTVIAYLRAAEQAGMQPADALAKIVVNVAVDDDQFLGIAKLRAARALIARLVTACGADAARVQVTAETSARMMARRDPWVNLLRTTIACAAAAMGGADTITVLPFTSALGRPDAFARRLARNTQIILQEESGLSRVADPAGGSWYVERLSDELAREAWEIMQAIEARGGMAAALTSGYVRDVIAVSAAARAKDIATGRRALTGVSAFPLLGDDGVRVEPWPPALSADLNGARAEPLRAQRLAEPFERLRDAADAFTARTGRRPCVFLASLGPPASHSARTTWTRNFLAAGGIEAITSEGVTSSADAGRDFAASGATVACLCGSDQAYAELGEATASLLKSAGARRLYLAGRPKPQEAALAAAGVDGFIFAGCDMLAALAELHAALGASQVRGG